MKRFLAVAALLAVAQTAWTQTSCEALSSANELSLKRIAFELFTGDMSDNSAPRATLRELRVNNQLQLIAINLQLMIKANCAMPAQPVDIQAYAGQANACGSAISKRGLGARPEECFIEKWQRMKP